MRNATYNAFSLSFYRSNSLFLYYQSIRTFSKRKLIVMNLFLGNLSFQNFALYQFGSTKNAVLTKLSIQHFYLYDIYLQNFIQVRSYLAVTIQFLIFGQASND